jgi:exonuclease VII large subunit
LQAEAGIGLSGSKFYEERAKMQQKLEQTIRQLLDRKNNELEDIKSANRVQVHKMEAQIKSLERQVNHLQRECAHLQGELQRQEEDRSLSYQQQKISMQNEVQQQLVDSREAFEQEKLALQQKHTHQMQKILEESASQMTRLEDTCCIVDFLC